MTGQRRQSVRRAARAAFDAYLRARDGDREDERYAEVDAAMVNLREALALRPVGASPETTNRGHIEADSPPKDDRCPAVCHVGPGHQSRVRCELPAGHESVHQRSIVEYEWDEDGECVGW